MSSGAFSQALPKVDPAGVVNGASYAQPIAPGSLVSIFGTNLAATTMTAQETPLPTEFAGTSVTLNGIKAPLLFVSPSQINLQAPSSLSISYSAYSQATVTVITAVGSSIPVKLPRRRERMWTGHRSQCRSRWCAFRELAIEQRRTGRLHCPLWDGIGHVPN